MNLGNGDTMDSMWFHTWHGSLALALTLKKTSNSKETGENVFHLHRMRCSHPSNPQFQWLLAIVTGTHCE